MAQVEPLGATTKLRGKRLISVADGQFGRKGGQKTGMGQARCLLYLAGNNAHLPEANIFVASPSPLYHSL